VTPHPKLIVFKSKFGKRRKRCVREFQLGPEAERERLRERERGREFRFVLERI